MVIYSFTVSSLMVIMQKSGETSAIFTTRHFHLVDGVSRRWATYSTEEFLEWFFVCLHRLFAFNGEKIK